MWFLAVRDFFDKPILEWLVMSGIVIVVIGVLVWLVVRIRTRYWDDEDPAAADQQMLLQIGELRREGDLTDEEFRSIKGRLVNRLQESGFAESDAHTSPSENRED